MPKVDLRVAGALLAVILATLLAINYSNNQANKDCTDDYRQDSVVLTPNQTKLAVEIVTSRSAQAKGLAGRDCIAQDWGMLFSFADSDTRSFWMKNMNFAIDIIWIDENLTVIGVESNVNPNTYPKTFSSPSPAKYVLEIGANQAERLGLTPGSILTF